MSRRRVAIIDHRTCAVCKVLDGHLVDGTMVQMPPAQCRYQFDAPWSDESCRCVAVKVQGWFGRLVTWVLDAGLPASGAWGFGGGAVLVLALIAWLSLRSWGWFHHLLHEWYGP